MAFGREASVTPVGIGAMSIELYDPVPGGEESQRATVSVQVVMSDRNIVVRQFDLADHVSAATINQLIALAATLRTKAVAEILP